MNRCICFIPRTLGNDVILNYVRQSNQRGGGRGSQEPLERTHGQNQGGIGSGVGGGDGGGGRARWGVNGNNST